MSINPLANKKPARRFLVLILIIAAAVSIAYIGSRLIIDTESQAVPVDQVQEKGEYRDYYKE
ncbi:MAG: hypothetical protein AAFY45_18550 [Bacteroidota bacterium]